MTLPKKLTTTASANFMCKNFFFSFVKFHFQAHITSKLGPAECKQQRKMKAVISICPFLMTHTIIMYSLCTMVCFLCKPFGN